MNEERLEYMQVLSEDYGIALDTVISLAELLGEYEDYDGLLTALDDIGGDEYV